MAAYTWEPEMNIPQHIIRYPYISGFEHVFIYSELLAYK